jgi:hypothetical protein
MLLVYFVRRHTPVPSCARFTRHGCVWLKYMAVFWLQREKVGVSVSEAQLSAALRGFVSLLDAELEVLPDGSIPSDGSATEERRMDLAERYLGWRRARLIEVRRWCDGMCKGIDAEGPTWWTDSTVTKL